MDFALSPEQQQIVAAIERLCAPFDADYWLAKDSDGGFPHDFHQALAQAGWLGIAMPTAYGGAGLGITEAALMMHTIAASGAGLSGASAVHMNIFGLHPAVVFGSEAQKARWLPPLIAGQDKACFAVTEPDSGLNTLGLKTRAVRGVDKRGDHYRVNGQKLWIGLGRAALGRAAAYARERVVFNRPIGQNQAIAHPLARNWMELEAAHLMVHKAATLYDAHQPCAAEANAAKYLGAEACFRACESAMFTHGGMGYAREFHVERYLREAWIPRLAPVSPQLILCFIAEKVLGLPKSY